MKKEDEALGLTDHQESLFLFRSVVNLTVSMMPVLDFSTQRARKAVRYARPSHAARWHANLTRRPATATWGGYVRVHM